MSDVEKKLFVDYLSQAVFDNPQLLADFFNALLQRRFPDGYKGLMATHDVLTVKFVEKPKRTRDLRFSCWVMFSDKRIVDWMRTLPEKEFPVPPSELCCPDRAVPALWISRFGFQEPGAVWLSDASLFQDVSSQFRKVCLNSVIGAGCQFDPCDFSHEPTPRYLLHQLFHEICKRTGDVTVSPRLCMFSVCSNACRKSPCTFIHSRDVRDEFVRLTQGIRTIGSYEWIKIALADLSVAASDSYSPPSSEPATRGIAQAASRTPSPRVELPASWASRGSATTTSSATRGVSSAVSRSSADAEVPPRAPSASGSSAETSSPLSDSELNNPEDQVVVAPMPSPSPAQSSSFLPPPQPAAPLAPPQPAAFPEISRPSNLDGIMGQFHAMMISYEAKREETHKVEVEELRARVSELETAVQDLEKTVRVMKAQDLDKLEDDQLKKLQSELEMCLKAVKDEQENRLLCPICMNKPKRVMFLPCCHLMCEVDAEKFTDCPICKATIVSKVTPRF